MGRMFGTGREPLSLLKSNIVYAMANSKSNMEAARFLRISYPTYKKYAQMYRNDDTGQSLFEQHKNQQGVGVAKPYNIKKGKYAMEDILEGAYPEYPVSNLKKRIISNSILEECCDNCNFSIEGHHDRFETQIGIGSSIIGNLGDNLRLENQSKNSPE